MSGSGFGFHIAVTVAARALAAIPTKAKLIINRTKRRRHVLTIVARGPITKFNLTSRFSTRSPSPSVQLTTLCRKHRFQLLVDAGVSQPRK
jgi:hypothetical protein